MNKNSFLLFAILLLCVGCSSTKQEGDPAANCYVIADLPGIKPATDANQSDDPYRQKDPLEPLNRLFYGIHYVTDHLVLMPLTSLYVEAMPEYFQARVFNFTANLSEPLTMAHSLLTFDIESFSYSLARLFINSTAGLLGLFDVAADVLDMPKKPKDFGDTLETWGIDSGPYLFIPILGPSNLRSTLGRVGQWYGDPYNVLMREKNSHDYIYARTGLEGLEQRRKFLDLSRELYKKDDSYAQVRLYYMQNTNMVAASEQSGPVPDNVERDKDEDDA